MIRVAASFFGLFLWLSPALAFAGWHSYSCPPPRDLQGVRSLNDLLGEHYSPAENLEAIDLAFINAAQRSLDIAMYAFTDHKLAKAVVRAARRGVVVRIYRDRIQVNDRGDQTGYILSRSPQGRVTIKIKNNVEKNIMHIKGYAVDGLFLRTGSANWSPSGEGAWCGLDQRPHNEQQDNTLFLTDDSRQIAGFIANFNHIFSRPTNISAALR